MTSSGAGPGTASDHGNLEALAEEAFTHPRSCESNLKMLRAVAAELFYRKRVNTSILEGEVAELRGLVETIAVVVSKTYVERGDSFVLADDEALTIISDLLIQYHPSILARNRNKKIPRRLFR
jgi:hypothetical protein